MEKAHTPGFEYKGHLGLKNRDRFIYKTGAFHKNSISRSLSKNYCPLLYRNNGGIRFLAKVSAISSPVILQNGRGK